MRTKNEALACVCPSAGIYLGDNCCTYGSKDNYVRVSLATSGEVQMFGRLSIKHIRDGETVDTWSIDMTVDKHKPGVAQRNVANLKGGYYWGYDSKWYNYVPIRVKTKITEIIEFTGVLEPVTT